MDDPGAHVAIEDIRVTSGKLIGGEIAVLLVLKIDHNVLWFVVYCSMKCVFIFFFKYYLIYSIRNNSSPIFYIIIDD